MRVSNRPASTSATTPASSSSAAASPDKKDGVSNLFGF